jgi:hypothetical protein
MAAEVVQLTASNVPRLHAASALHSLKKAHARPTATLILALAVLSHVRRTATGMTAHLAVTAQNLVVHGVTVTTQAVASAHTVSVQTDLHTVVTTVAIAKTKVHMAVTGRLEATKALVARRSAPGETQPIAIHAQAMVAMTAHRAKTAVASVHMVSVQSVRHTETVMTAAAAQHGAIATTAHLVANGQKKSQLAQVVKTAQATVAMIALVSKTVRPSAAGAATQTTAATAAMTANHATLTAQIVPSVTLHARPLSVEHAMLTQTRRHSSKTRCLSA